MDGELEARLNAHLAREGAGMRVVALELLSGGACQENFRVELEQAGDGRRLFVLRSDARTTLPGSIDRAQEFEVVSAAAARGVRTPAPRWFGRGLVREDAGAYFLDFVPGEAIGRKVVASPALAGARERLAETLARELAKIHGLTPADAPGLLGGAAPADPLEHRLGLMRKAIDALKQPRPAVELAFSWLRERATPESEVVLAHGDYRTGNFLVGQDGLSAILDWEFSHWGSPYFDLAWIAVRDWRFGKLDLPIGGFARRAPFYEAYEAASGRELDPVKLHYWEVLCNVHWAIGSVVQGERYVYGGEPDLELLAVGRRACEMELEALRLIERGKL